MTLRHFILRQSFRPFIGLFLGPFIGLALVAAAVVWPAACPAAAEGVHCSTIVDEDGDEAILLESEWISMHLLPWRQALINRFVFRPTGNDIVEQTMPKFRMSGGGGILMDCFWEQDWRFQELAYKQYPYKITKNGPDEGQVVFETDIVGWLGSDNSGLISKLLSNLTLRRTVTLKTGQPFFRFDFEFINNDTNAKRPTFWVHNVSYTGRGGKETVVRPTDRCLSAIGGDQESYAGPQGQQFVDFFNQGWTANISKERREGIVYLFDYDYVEQLYNCFENQAASGSTEWWYDSILVFKDKPWKGRVYILPVIGLERIDYANRFFICGLEPKHETGRLTVDIGVTSSYESAAKVTFAITAAADLQKPADARPTITLPPVEFDGLAIQPKRETVAIDCTDADPILLSIKAFVELPDGKLETFEFQRFFTGEYKFKGNTTDVVPGAPPLVKLDRKVRKPAVPPPPAGLAINRRDFHVFGVHGFGSMRSRLAEAVASIPSARYDIGYCNGTAASQTGLTDFPYDYARLFDCRTLVLSNVQDREFRRIGGSILMPWLEAGGGLVIVGGENAFSFEYEEHPINDRYPIAVSPGSLRLEPAALGKPEMADHPVFRGIDLSSPPVVPCVHHVSLKPGRDAKVLWTAGGQPFLVEQRTGDQVTMVVAANPFGDPQAVPGKPTLRDWPEWPKLFANIVRYAAHDLK